jgi:hypothetical protein
MNDTCELMRAEDGRLTGTLDVDRLTEHVLKMPQANCPVTHHFDPGIYLREVFMPAGCFAIGFKHRTQFINILLSGRLRLVMDGAVTEMVGPAFVTTPPGMQKMALILEDCRWLTIHPTAGIEWAGNDVDKLEEALLFPSEVLEAHKAEAQRLLSYHKEAA